MEYKELNNGMKMPSLGIGTFMLEPDVAEEAVCNALKNGYRLIDTANAYVNEKAVGRGMKKSGLPREEIFLETKLWQSEYKYDDALKAIDETLARLDTDYIDLLLLHQQYGEYIDAYKAMEKAYELGKVKSIGLSNFNEERFEDVINKCEILPAVHQIETQQ